MIFEPTCFATAPILSRAMHLVFLSAFLLGLVLGVYVMIRGVERIKPPAGTAPVDALGRPVGVARMAFATPTIGAFAAVFGATGYLLRRYADLRDVTVLIVAITVAAVGAVVAGRLVARWARLAATHDAPDERYLLQGHPARVVSPIGAVGPGQIAYVLGGTRYAASARSVDGSAVPADTDVVIERVENGVVYVEPWVRVEQRI